MRYATAPIAISVGWTGADCRSPAKHDTGVSSLATRVAARRKRKRTNMHDRNRAYRLQLRAAP
jgi:hypothetical protein